MIPLSCVGCDYFVKRMVIRVSILKLRMGEVGLDAE